MDVTLTLDSSAGTLDIDPGSAQLNGAMALARPDDPAWLREPVPIEATLLRPGVCE